MKKIYLILFSLLMLWTSLSFRQSVFAETKEVIDPLQGEVSSGYGFRIDPLSGDLRFHYGLDFIAEEGEDVLSCEPSTVIETGEDEEAGKYVILQTSSGLYLHYFHLSSIEVEKDQPLEKGEVIGKVGQTGRATGPHSHFGVGFEPFGQYVNPHEYLENRLTVLH